MTLLNPIIDKNNTRVIVSLDEIQKALILETGCTAKQAADMVAETTRFATWYNPTAVYQCCRRYLRAEVIIANIEEATKP